MGDVARVFLDRLMRHFTLPKGADGKEADWEQDYQDELSFYSDAVLEFAARKLIFADRQSKSFPTPAQCLKACMEVHADFAKVQPAPAKRDEWSTEAMREADRLLASATGRKAAEEGWVWQLWDFLRREGRWPDFHEGQAMRTKSAAMRADLDEFLSAEERAGRPIVPAARALLVTMAARREHLDKIARGERQA